MSELLSKSLSSTSSYDKMYYAGIIEAMLLIASKPEEERKE